MVSRIQKTLGLAQENGLFFHKCPCGWSGMAEQELTEHDCKIQIPGHGKPVVVPVEIGLGDWAEAGLKSLGITKERYRVIKEEFGLPPECDCDARKEWLNKVASGKRIANGLNRVADFFTEWRKRKGN